jgi:cation diffusion facilitator family transporter
MTFPPDLKQKRLNAAKFSLLASIGLTLLKYAAFLITDSQAVLSDALENIINAIAAAFALWAIVNASRPADRHHPYGYGKMEYFSSAFEGALVMVASLFLIFNGIRALLQGHALHHLELGSLMVALAGLLNLALGRLLIHLGNKTQSAALTASGKHVMTDFWTSLGVLLGLLLVHLTGQHWLDPALAILIGLQLGVSGWNITKGALQRLADQADPATIQSLTHAIQTHAREGIIHLHHLRVLKTGRHHHIDCHLVCPGHWTIDHAHDLAERFEQDVIAQCAMEGELAFHIDPCRQKYCRCCSVSPCPHRLHEFKDSSDFNLLTITALTEEEALQAESCHMNRGEH